MNKSKEWVLHKSLRWCIYSDVLPMLASLGLGFGLGNAVEVTADTHQVYYTDRHFRSAMAVGSTSTQLSDGVRCDVPPVLRQRCRTKGMQNDTHGIS